MRLFNREPRSPSEVSPHAMGSDKAVTNPGFPCIVTHLLDFSGLYHAQTLRLGVQPCKPPGPLVKPKPGLHGVVASARAQGQDCIKLVRFMRQGWFLIAFSETNPAGLAAGSRWSARGKRADHRVNADIASCTQKGCQNGCQPLPGQGLFLQANARFWHPSRMQSSPARVSGGRFPFGPKTTTGYHLPTLRVGLAGRKGGEGLTPARAGTRQSELDAALPLGMSAR